MDLDARVRDPRRHVLVDDVRSNCRVTLTLDDDCLSAEQGGKHAWRPAGTPGSPLSPRSACCRRRGRPTCKAGSRSSWKVDHRGKVRRGESKTSRARAARARSAKTQFALTGIVDDPGPHARFDLRAKGDLPRLRRSARIGGRRRAGGGVGLRPMAFDVAAWFRRLRLGAAAARPAAGSRCPDAAAATPARCRREALSLRVELAPDTVSLTSSPPSPGRRCAPRRARAARRPAPSGTSTLNGTDPTRFAARRPERREAVGPRRGRGSGRAKDPGLDGTRRPRRAQERARRVEGPARPSREVNGVVLLAAARGGAAPEREGRTVVVHDRRDGHAPARADGDCAARGRHAVRLPLADAGPADLLPTTPGAPFLPNAKGTGTVAIDRLKQASSGREGRARERRARARRARGARVFAAAGLRRHGARHREVRPARHRAPGVRAHVHDRARAGGRHPVGVVAREGAAQGHA